MTESVLSKQTIADMGKYDVFQLQGFDFVRLESVTIESPLFGTLYGCLDLLNMEVEYHQGNVVVLYRGKFTSMKLA